MGTNLGKWAVIAAVQEVRNVGGNIKEQALAAVSAAIANGVDYNEMAAAIKGRSPSMVIWIAERRLDAKLSHDYNNPNKI